MVPSVVRKLAIDATDIAIIREYVQATAGRFQSEKVSMQAMARSLGMHPNTVADRVKRIEDAGWLLPMTILPTPPVVGLSIGRFFVPMTMAQRTPARLAQVMELSCVFYVEDLLEGWEPGVIAADDDALEALAQKIVGMLGGDKVEWMIHSTRDWPAMPHHDLDETDLAILEALLDDTQASLDELAAKLKMNARTLRRHHERLREVGAFRIYPYGTGALATGLSLRQFQVSLPEAGPERQVIDAEIGRLLPNLLTRQALLRGAWYVLYGDEPGELKAQVERVANIPGVTLIEDRHFRRFITNPNYPQQVMGLLRAKLREKPIVAKA